MMEQKKLVTEYIERAVALERNDLEWYDLGKVVHSDLVRDRNEEIINSIPSANVVEVRYGKWIEYETVGRFEESPIYGVLSWKCSLCGNVSDICTPFCPNCGAEMI